MSSIGGESVHFERKKDWTVIMVIVSILFLLPIIEVPTLAISAVDVTLLPGSSTTFFKCGVGSNYHWNDTLPGMTGNESAKATFLNASGNTWIGGKALFDVAMRRIVIVNEPGPDLAVHEIAGAESFKMAVYDPASGNFTGFKLFSVSPTGKLNSCNQSINAVNIDLSVFAIPNGASISLLRFDNMGKHACCFGADIAGIVPIHWKGTNPSNATIAGGIIHY